MTKSYTSNSSAKSAVENSGLQNVPHFIHSTSDERYEPRFFVDLAADAGEIKRRDFFVTHIDWSKFKEALQSRNGHYTLKDVTEHFECPHDIARQYLKEAVAEGVFDTVDGIVWCDPEPSVAVGDHISDALGKVFEVTHVDGSQAVLVDTLVYTNEQGGQMVKINGGLFQKVVRPAPSDSGYDPEEVNTLPVPHIHRDGSVSEFEIKTFVNTNASDLSFLSLQSGDSSVHVNSKEHAEAVARAILIAADRVWGA